MQDAEGPGWRWWTDEMFPTSCTGSYEQLRNEGVTMDEFNIMAMANGASVAMQRTTDADANLTAFRSSIVETAEMRSEAFIVASFCRAKLGQTGSGHFSPIGAYHTASDSVLVLDVARFKYPPYWVSVPALWAACSAFDPTTGRARGWFRLTAAEHLRMPR